MKTFVLLFCIFFHFLVFAQNVGVGTTSPTTKLEVMNALKSTVKISSASYDDTSQLIFSNRISALAGTDFLLTSIREQGLFFSSQSDIPSNNFSNSLVISPGGNIGLGINAPVYKLQINNPTAISTYMSITNTSTGITSGDGLLMGMTGSTAILANLESGNLQLGTSNLTRMTIDDAGFVGIGLTTPLSLLQLHDASTSNSHLRFTHSGTGTASTDGMRIGLSGFSAVISNLENGNMLFATNNSNRVVIDATGNMGVGNLSPTNKLDVTGDFNVSGLLKIDGSSGATGQVLTSNGGSSPTWQSVANPQNGFHAENTSTSQTIVPLAASGTRLDINTEIFDDGSDYSSATDAFTAPANGVYHFDVKVNFFDADPGNYRLYLDNNTSFGDGEYALVYHQVGVVGTTSLVLSITLKLTAGQQVLAHVWHNATTDQSARGMYFTGHRVY